MSKQEQDKSYFIAFCIEQYKVAKGMDGAEVARLFFEKGISEYLNDNFEILHTQSRQWLIEEIDGLLDQSGESCIEGNRTSHEASCSLEVTQQNLHLFLPGKVANVASIIADNDHCSMLDAMQRFYASEVYQGLEKEDTKLWHLGAVALYEMM